MHHDAGSAIANSAVSDRLFPGNGPSARRCRELDWSATPLGAASAWPANLGAVAALVVASPLPMMLLWGPELVQIYNDSYAALMGDSFPDGIGKPTRQCWPQMWKRNAPFYDGVISRGKSFTLESQRFIVRRGVHSEEICINLAFSPAFDAGGAAAGVMVILTSTETGAAPLPGEAAASNEERLRTALDGADLGTWDLDLVADTATRSLRHDQIFGYPEHQQQWGMEVATRHVLAEDRPVFRQAFARAIASGVMSCEVRVRWPDGSIHWIAPLGRMYFDSAGQPVRMAGVVADVTERNRSTTLRQSEERFRLMADVVPQIVWVTDADGGVEFFNQQWRNYTGFAYDPETAAAVAAAAVHPDDVAVTMEHFNRARACGTTFLVEHRIRAAAGHYRWFLVRAEPYRDPATGQISRWFGASVDIHDRKLIEDHLRQLTRRQTFQIALADHIRPLAEPQQVTAAACELLGRHLEAQRVIFCEVDDAGERVVLQPGWTESTLIVMDGMQLTMDDFGPLIADELRAGRAVAIDDVATDARAAPYVAAYRSRDIAAMLAIALMKQGRLRAVLSIHCARARHWSSNDIALAEDMVDRTWSAVESVRAQTKLRIERDRSQSVFDGMNEGVSLICSDWTVREMNAEGLRIAQRTRAQVIGKNHWAIWPETAGGVLQPMYTRVMATRMPDTLEYCQTFGNGHSAWIEVRAFPAGSDELAVFFRDISRRKGIEKKLQDADRRKDEFLAMLAHELRNPLAPIGAAAQLLQVATLDEARVRHTSQIIGRQVEHMTHLINDLLDVSRVTRGLVELERAPLDMRAIVVDAVEQVTPLMQARRHQLVLHLPPDMALVLGDKKRLVQVLANILNNAAKYTHEGGHISLSAEVRDAHIVIEVADNGIGMLPDLALHAFELFAQAERTSDRSAGGLGLGLALVKNLVELHGGTVACDSAGIGKGSRFSICLPRIAVQAQQSLPDSVQRAAPHAHAQPLRLMVVDDNVDAAAMLAMLLEASGHQVMVEHDSRRALQRSRGDPPDVFLLDIGLPDMDGNQLARRLRAQPETAGALLIAVTGYGQEVDRQRTLAAGFDHHLIKPVDIVALAGILAGVATGRPSGAH